MTRRRDMVPRWAENRGKATTLRFFFLVFANSAAKVDRPKEMESDPRRKKKIPKKEKHI